MHLNRWSRAVVIVGLITTMTASIWSQTSPTTKQNSTDIAGLSDAELNNRIDQIRLELNNVVTPDIISDHAARDIVSSDTIQKMKSLVALDCERQKRDGSDASMVSLDQLLIAFLGDSGEQADLNRRAQSSDRSEALSGQTALMTVQFWKNNGNPAVQNDVLDRIESLAVANPSDPRIASALQAMYRVGASDRAVSDRAATILIDKMTGSLSTAMKLDFEGVKKLRKLEGKPMVLVGKTFDGNAFSTDRWKGKVILVDFWATWCGPCVAKLPKIGQLYQTYHEKGLEIVGVSNDYNADKLRLFLTGHPHISWPQLFDADAATQKAWNPITRDYGIGSIPRIFVIDQNGICRSVDSGYDLDATIQSLLAS